VLNVVAVVGTVVLAAVVLAAGAEVVLVSVLWADPLLLLPHPATASAPMAKAAKANLDLMYGSFSRQRALCIEMGSAIRHRSEVKRRDGRLGERR